MKFIFAYPVQCISPASVIRWLVVCGYAVDQKPFLFGLFLRYDCRRAITTDTTLLKCMLVYVLQYYLCRRIATSMTVIEQHLRLNSFLLMYCVVHCTPWLL